MLNQELLQNLSKPLSKAEVLAYAAAYTVAVEDLIAISLHPEHEISFRACWILEHIAEVHPAQFAVHMPAFLDAYMAQQNTSSMRHFTKIMMHFSSSGQSFKPADVERIIEITFDWMIDDRTPVAVQVNCMDILYNFRNDAEWIRTELEAQIGFLMKDGSAAMQSRGKRLLAKLARERKAVSRSK